MITQSDTLEEDEDPDGSIVRRWIMKDKQKRQGQIDYVRRAVSESGCGQALDILSISVRYAEKHCNDPAALEESGMADLFRLLTDIVQSEGVHRKRETPSRNLDHFVELVGAADPCGSTLPVGNVLTRLDDLKNKLGSADKDLDRRAGRITANVFGKIGVIASELIARHAGDKNQAEFERECSEALHQIVAEEIGTQIEAVMEGGRGAFGQTVNPVQISGFLKFESFLVKIPKSNRKAAGAAGAGLGGIGGAWAGAAAGTALIPIPIVGTAIGMMLGTFFGSAAGSGVGEALGSDWEETMQSGDNRADVEAKAVKALQDAGQAAVDAFFENVKRNAIVPIQERAMHLEVLLTAFSEFLMNRVHSNGRSVPSRV